MNFYLKTEMGAKGVEKQLKRYLYLNSVYVDIPDNFKNYLKLNYNITLNQILIAIRNNTRVLQVDENSVQIIVINTDLNNTSLQSLMQLVEYGNREIQGTHQISLLFQRSIVAVRKMFRGV